MMGWIVFALETYHSSGLKEDDWDAQVACR
jgi:hypothetical protein